MLDANLLLLYLVGAVHPLGIGRKRLTEYDPSDLILLHKHIGRKPRHVTTPNILTEVSNLLGSGAQQLVPNGASALRDFARDVEETYVPSCEAVFHSAYLKLGLSDCVIMELAKRETKIISADWALCGLLESAGLKVENFNHARTPRKDR